MSDTGPRRLRKAAEAGRQLLDDATSLNEMPGLASQLAYEALRAGAPAAPQLERMAARAASRGSSLPTHATPRRRWPATALRGMQKLGINDRRDL